ncbi:ribonuclease P protein subunit p29 [Trichechus manatus latirostris]|uniref:Ribonuclease P protein subunit p29 n=1 Tax=Trichechus manatus latirostris TaxID=127582 RepID=A0A2Y9QKZ3_TRIMA|nr:ribonuclease P protein subunit p29 [Trichechus manatus latirostris]
MPHIKNNTENPKSDKTKETSAITPASAGLLNAPRGTPQDYQNGRAEVLQINRYSLFLPLHELWKQYIRNLCNGLKPDTQPEMIQAKLLKADLHGAVISVTKSKCPSYVGVTGILLQETKYVFRIITKEDRLKVIPKLNCVFAVEIDGFISYIYGSKFQLRSSERSAKKFKAKGTIDL